MGASYRQFPAEYVAFALGACWVVPYSTWLPFYVSGLGRDLGPYLAFWWGVTGCPALQLGVVVLLARRDDDPHGTRRFLAWVGTVAGFTGLAHGVPVVLNLV